MSRRDMGIACSAFLLAACASNAFAQRSGAVSEGAIDRAIAAGERFLSARIDSAGRCKSEYAAFNPRFGGRTALCAYALIEAGASPKDPAVARAINWLAKAKLSGVYATAMRANVLAALPPGKRVRELLERDVKWLIRAAAEDGSYTYTSMGGKPAKTYDNSNSQMAVLGVWAGASRGVEVPAQYWRRVERFWLAQQQNDGG